MAGYFSDRTQGVGAYDKDDPSQIHVHYAARNVIRSLCLISRRLRPV